MAGGDWADAGVDHLIVPKRIDVKAEQKKYKIWLKDVWEHMKRKKKHKEHMFFRDWLLRLGAKVATDDQVLEIWDE